MLSRKFRAMLTTPAIAVLGVFFSIGLSAAAGQSQSQPPVTQSPTIILPPQSPQKATPPSAQTGTPTPESPASEKPSKGNPDQAKVATANPTALGPAYVIGPEDILYVKVWHDVDFSGQVTVGPDGMISIQVIGEVRAAGLTERQLEQELEKRLKVCCLKEPEVNVQVLRANSRTYVILGDGINKPGMYPLPRPLTVLQALLAGGGFSPFANKKKIYVLRGTTKFSFNWDEVIKGKHLEQNILIQNGDQIVVP
jgi:polysaccharide export outer membrane protein